ncbi:AIF_collapsed_G0032030.mRNA.1.CDS.1 [Saccharomyces cerevisiae]|nr:AIF_collapsed_G0032030.mRNA.1.CDS.1 [Saccharomyces cerevisiae]
MNSDDDNDAEKKDTGDEYAEVSREKKKKKDVGTTSHEATLFEYGESIAGYKCVTTESERDRLKRSHERENSSESEVDVFAFDQAKGISTKVEAEERYARAV